MSRIAVVWAGLGDDDAEATDWYENRHIPSAVAEIKSTARNAEQVGENAFQEVPQVEGKHMTIYDLPDGQGEQDLEAEIRPILGDLPRQARLNTRFFSEHANWYGEDWRGDPRDVQMWIVVLWQPTAAVHDEFVQWFRDEFAPGMLESPELLRTRIFKLEHATNIRGQKHERVEKESVLQYMTFWEFDSPELPWEILVYLGSSERWRHYVEGGYLKWEMGQYLEYQDQDDRNSRQDSSEDDDVSGGGSDSDPFELR